MNPADAQLIQFIQQVTQGASRLLITLARRGKALDRDDPRRAAVLLAAVGAHPLYKGGRLAFDMLEIEDLMLDASRMDPMSARELMEVLNAGAGELAETLRRMGTEAQDGSLPAAALLPRVTLGPADGVARTASASAAGEEGPERTDNQPELQASDYLYDYVVVGFLDVIGAARTFQF